LKQYLLVIIVSFATIIVLGTFIAKNAKYNNIKDAVLEKNPQITNIESINSLGGWGEWSSEYSLVVDINGKKYRVWTLGDGNLTDKVELDRYNN
jgi:uncharacterized protein YneF (UPF0154 family)